MSKKSVKKPDYAKFEANRAVKKKNKKKTRLPMTAGSLCLQEVDETDQARRLTVPNSRSC